MGILPLAVTAEDDDLAAGPDRPVDGAVPGRVVGGADAEAGEYPFMAAVLESESEGSAVDRHYCGGVVVHARWVLTAAHCVVDRFPSELEVFVGGVDLARDDVGVRMPVVDIVVHPAFDPITNDSDLALLLLAERVPEGVWGVPLNRDPSREESGVPARVLGWGATNPDEIPPTSPILQAGEVPIVANEVAEKVYGTVTPNMLFAGSEDAGAPNTCAGDSGGPLLVPDGMVADRWLLAGVTSFGRDDVPCDAPAAYGGYVRVSRFVDWIRRIVMPATAAWEGHFKVAADLGDEDGDGACNLVEMALGGDPIDPRRAPELRSVQGEWAGSTWPAIRFLRPLAWSEVDYHVEFSDRMGEWRRLDPEEFAMGAVLPAGPGEDGLERGWATLRAPVALGGNSGRQGFFRVVVEARERFVPTVRPLRFPGFVRAALHTEDLPLGESAGMATEKWYRLDGVGDEERVVVTLLAPGFPGSLEVLDAETRELLGTDAANAGAPDTSRIELTTGGRPALLIRVGAQQNPGEPNGGDFLLTVGRPIDQVPVVALGQAREGELTASDSLDPAFLPEHYYMDEFRMPDIPPGVHVEVRMESRVVDSFLALVDARTGEVIQWNDDSGGGEDGVDAFLNFVAMPGRPLLLRASSALENQTGAYRLTLAPGSALAPGTEIEEALSPDDARNPGAEADRRRDDHHLTDVEPGERVLVTLTPMDFDAVLQIIDGADGTVLRTIDEETQGGTESVWFRAEAGHAYLARVTSAGPVLTGTYRIASASP